MNKNTKVITVGAALAALSLIIMSLTAVFPTMQYALVALAGLLPSLMVISYKASDGWILYAAVSILSLILLPDKQGVLFYILLFGHYPMVKSLIEKNIRKVWLEWGIKLLVANILFVAVYHLSVLLFAQEVSLNDFPLWLFWLIANIAFILYDLCFSKIIVTIWPRVLSALKLSK